MTFPNVASHPSVDEFHLTRGDDVGSFPPRMGCYLPSRASINPIAVAASTRMSRTTMCTLLLRSDDRRDGEYHCRLDGEPQSLHYLLPPLARMFLMTQRSIVKGPEGVDGGEMIIIHIPSQFGNRETRLNDSPCVVSLC